MSKGSHLDKNKIGEILRYLEEHDQYDTMREYELSADSIRRIVFLKDCVNETNLQKLMLEKKKHSLSTAMVEVAQEQIRKKQEKEDAGKEQIEFENVAVEQSKPEYNEQLDQLIRSNWAIVEMLKRIAERI